VIAVLPSLVVLTDRRQCGPAGLVATVRDGVDLGVRAVVLREKDLSHSQRAALAAELRAVLDPVEGRLLVASDPSIASAGVHLAADDPFPTARPGIVGRSCHSLDDVIVAEHEGCDYATLSPIFASSSKPGYGPALGPSELRRVVRRTTLPVFALGGIEGPELVAECVSARAAGVAVMGAAMRDPNTLADLFPDRVDHDANAGTEDQ
jgi:thiamine-phosphate pyrophosphorylase